ncbi:MAG: hypothetical protein FWC73_03635 [Defluviitaleaceae bacterium]|nr:hypothetical protein [Defluviitaleaceae bacterium]
MNKEATRANKYNSNHYHRYAFRVRKGSQLAEKIIANTDDGEFSFNFLVTKLLCEHFNIDLPHKYYSHRTVLYDARNQGDDSGA